MSNTNLLPISDTKQFLDAGGQIIIPRYRTGDPRNYRLDLSNGVLNLEGREQVTKPGMTFSVIPVAFRCLEHGLFGQEVKKWCEVYFVNQQGHLSMFMFHGFSVDNLSRATRDLYYQERSLCEVVWDIKLELKMNKEGQKYFMADFTFDLIDEEGLAIIKGLHENIISYYYHIYRSDTADTRTLFSENWSDGKEPTAKELEMEQQRIEDLKMVFATPEEKKAKEEADKKKKKELKAA